MNIMDYLKDKSIYIILYIFQILFISIFLYLFHMNMPCIIILFVFQCCVGMIVVLINYYRKKTFYNTLINNAEKLDKKYYVIEMLPQPTTYEERIIYELLYDIDKSMNEAIKELENNTKDYIEFIEMWIHEVKIPLSTLLLKCHNNPNVYGKEFSLLVHRLDHYVEEVLYYVRGETSQKDYMIQEVSLQEIIRKAIISNKEDILENNIEIQMDCHNEMVHTDAKWMVFILNQIINNSIKYKKDENANINISVSQKDKQVYLSIKDNGMGISSKDIKNVFDKSFTGENGRIKKATGMGLYIVKNMCNKLGHKVEIDSIKNEYTTITIIFNNHDYYKF